MDDQQRQRLADKIAELDEIIPTNGGKVKITGSWPDISRMHADRMGFLRLGLLLLHVGSDKGRRKREVDDELFVSDSQFKFSELMLVDERSGASSNILDDKLDTNTARAGGLIIAYAFGVIVVTTLICAGAYYFIHYSHSIFH